MRLIDVRIEGFRKLRGTGCTTPGKLTAFVGPNEVGKSSLLDALLSVETSDPIPYSDRPRDVVLDDEDVAIALRYELATEDEIALSLPKRNEPYVYKYSKRYGGSRVSSLTPRIKGEVAAQQLAHRELLKFARTKLAKSWGTSDANSDPLLGDMLATVLNRLQLEQAWDSEDRELVPSLIEALQEAQTAQAVRAATALERAISEIDQPDHHNVARIAVGKIRPSFQLFSDAARNLASSHDLPSIIDGSAPESLVNVLGLAGFTVEQLWAAIQANDVGKTVSVLAAGNIALASFFAEAWKQSPVSVRLDRNANELHILVSNEEGGDSSIAERSDGLKTYVALTAFIFSKTTSGRVILLIDEAEQHLHYDAQADLLRMLERQTLASQVLYTTHSPGCLPGDLGTGIRPVVKASAPDIGSRLSNAFWTSGRGFTPLLMAIGAAAAAFTPARYAVLVEGASDMLILPSLIREATGLSSLPYQIAPGISESSTTELRELDLAAPRVAYLVDSDEGGRALEKRLQDVGVEPSKILRLTKNGFRCLEDLIHDATYADATNAILARYSMSNQRVTRKDIVRPRPAKLKAWAKAAGCEIPAKTAIASELISADYGQLVSADSVKSLETLHQRICTALGIPQAAG